MAIGVYEVALVGQGNKGEAIVNTFYYQIDEDSLVATNCESIGDSFEADVLPSFAAAVTVDWKGHVLAVSCVQGPNEGQQHSRFINTQTGDKAGPSASYNICAVIRRRNAQGGRNGRGRIFVSPIAEVDVNVDGEITDTANKFEALAIAMLEELEAGVEAVCRAILWDVDGEIARVVNTTDVSPMSGQMRSRRLRFPN